MRAHSIVVVVGLGTACGAPGDSGQEASEPDATMAVDAEPDAPLLGHACPTRAVEVARIASANIFPTDLGPAFYRSATASFYTADADGDGDADLLVFEYTSSTSSSYVYRIRLFRHEGTGFTAAIESSITLPAAGAELDVLADVDGDHRKDLIVGYTTDFPRTPYLYIARQSSTGTFELQPSPRDVSACGASSDQRLEALAVVDVDRDGKDDVLTTVSLGGLGSSPAGLSLAPGTATGLAPSTCVASSTVTTAGYPAALAAAKLLRAGDFDGDGVADLVATSYAGGVATMQLYAARGTPDLRAVTGIVVPPSSRLLVDHVNGRARDGLLAIDVGPDHTDLTRYRTDAQSGITVEAPMTLAAGSSPSAHEVIYGFAAADFNHDQLTDVVEIGNQELASGPTPFVIACDRGSRWDHGAGTLPVGTRVLRAIDFDGDGQAELVARVGSDVVVFRLE